MYVRLLAGWEGRARLRLRSACGESTFGFRRPGGLPRSAEKKKGWALPGPYLDLEIASFSFFWFL